MSRRQSGRGFDPDAVAAGQSRVALRRSGARRSLAACSRGFPRGSTTGKSAGSLLARVTLLLFRNEDTDDTEDSESDSALINIWKGKGKGNPDYLIK